MAQADPAKIDSLVQQAKEGDKEAFSGLVRIMMQDVVAHTYRMTRDPDAAADLAQETFVAAWENLGQFREESRFSSWLYRIAANKSLNYLKRQSRQAGPSLDDIEGESVLAMSDSGSPEGDLYRREMRRGVLEFMSALPAQQRLVFDLRFYKQLSFDEISQVTGKALGTVKTHYREAVLKLREFAIARGWRQ